MIAAGPAARRLVVLSDTHIHGHSRGRQLPDAVYAALEGADAVLHAGDVVSPDFLAELSGFAPVHAVLGNNDHELFGVLPETVEVVVAGVRIAMIHDSGSTSGREARLAKRFPDAAVVVFGHSHAPLDAVGIGRQRLFNPGSPTQRRAQPRHTFGIICVDAGEVREHRIVPL